MGPENHNLQITAAKLYQVIEPGHYRPVGDVNDLTIISFANSTSPLIGKELLL